MNGTTADMSRKKKRNQDLRIFLELVKDGKYDINRQYDYKYNTTFSRTINWKLGRLNKTLQLYNSYIKNN